MAAPNRQSVEQFVERAAATHGAGPESLIPLLQAIQTEYGWLREDALNHLCEVTEITPAAVSGVASFYHRFRLRAGGRHIIRVCHGTACHVKGAERVDDELARALQIPPGSDTDAENRYTVEKVACLGCCTMAPLIHIDSISYGHVTPSVLPRILRDFERVSTAPACSSDASDPLTSPGLTEFRISLDSCCAVGGTAGLRQALEAALRESRSPGVVKLVGCNGLCHQVPMVEVAPARGAPTLYARVSPADAAPIVRRHLPPPGMRERIRSAWSAALDRALTDESWEPVTRYSVDARDPALCAYAGRQMRVATEYSGQLDPLNLEEYLQHDGFAALRSVVEAANPASVVEEITRSGLRGRGGAGFPTGVKWAAVRNAPGTPKYVICNGDEGDPGAFMDRMLLEAFPYRVLEGMAIAAFAVGAQDGILYIRAEYPHAIRRIREAIRRCTEQGVFEFPGWRLRLRVAEGAGAFVCGEETALIASLEGRRGEPRLRPPYPAESGLWGKPTNINNVETYALVPWILRHGAGAFAAIGTERSKGTKVFSLAGMIQRGGLIEVPMGITIREIVQDIGGGTAEGRRFKAVQIGGPSGGCVPAELADTPIDYESLVEAGAIMGSGGMVVLDDSSCMVDLARYFLTFLQDESCGKCTLCRVGTQRLREMLDRLCAGEGRAADLDKLEELCAAVKQGSLCGLGQTAANPILTTLRYFREEYIAHIEGRCPAGKCKPLIHYRVQPECIGCTLCAQECPVGAIAMRPFERHEIDDALCTRCDACRLICPENAIRIESP